MLTHAQVLAHIYIMVNC